MKIINKMNFKISNFFLNHKFKLVVSIIIFGIIGIVFIINNLCEYDLMPSSTGFCNYTIITTNQENIIIEKETFTRTLWDWFELLIFPIALALFAYYLNNYQKKMEHKIAEERFNLERELRKDYERENLLRKFFDDINYLLTEKNLMSSPVDSTERSIARNKTLTTVRELDGVRKGKLFEFLFDSKLISIENCIVDLSSADFSNTVLNNYIFEKIVLKHVNFLGSNLNGIFIIDSNISISNFNKSNLENMSFSGSSINRCTFNKSNLSSTYFDGAKITNSYFNNSIMKYATFSLAKIKRSKFIESDLHYGEFDGTEIYSSQFDKSVFENSVFSQSNVCFSRFHSSNLKNANFDFSNLSKIDFTNAIMGDDWNRNCSTQMDITLPDGQTIYQQ